jgi:hypothetical protein
MVTVVLGAAVSVAVVLFALFVIMREFEGRWPQVAAALAFDERAFVSGEFRPAAMPRRRQAAPVRSRHQASWRAAA